MAANLQLRLPSVPCGGKYLGFSATDLLMGQLCHYLLVGWTWLRPLKSKFGKLYHQCRVAAKQSSRSVPFGGKHAVKSAISAVWRQIPCEVFCYWFAYGPIVSLLFSGVDMIAILNHSSEYFTVSAVWRQYKPADKAPSVPCGGKYPLRFSAVDLLMSQLCHHFSVGWTWLGPSKQFCRLLCLQSYASAKICRHLLEKYLKISCHKI